MKTTLTLKKGIFPVAILLLAPLAFSLMSFMRLSHVEQEVTTAEYSMQKPCRILIGVGYRKMKCGTNVTSTFSSAEEFYGVTSSMSSYSEMEKEVESKLGEWYNIESNDVSIKSSLQPYAVVIKYPKKISGWNCTVNKMAVGFGDSLEAAEANAEKSKNNDVGSSTAYSVVKTYSCK